MQVHLAIDWHQNPVRFLRKNQIGTVCQSAFALLPLLLDCAESLCLTESCNAGSSRHRLASKSSTLLAQESDRNGLSVCFCTSSSSFRLRRITLPNGVL